jgi:uncharacterized lipoprotein YddW (UPF0748 family)
VQQQGSLAAREFRAAWVATVANINWPSKPGLSTEEQQREAIELLDFLKTHHFNAVILQVRPQADALYQSRLEPWSYYLTGQQGKAPDPYYDPLTFWTEAAHDRGLELHVWLNPYRAHHVSGGEVTDSSIVKRYPGLALYLKEGYWWFDPSLKAVQDHSAAVVRDLVKRYDIDGVHFDDYFYPYPSYNKNEDFPDSTSWAAYQASGGTLSRGDWRRQSVNDFIERVYREIKAEKKHVKFGLSPFGIWRPGYPESVGGFDQYDVLYADARLWLNKGWIDYFTPQLYWPISREAQSFPVLLGWWAGENRKHRHLWPGISVSRDTAYGSRETINQIMVARGMVPKSQGVVHWSISSVTKNPTLSKALIEGPYRKPALVPASKWLDKKEPKAPVVTTETGTEKVTVRWSHPKEKDVFRWVVYYQYGTTWNYQILNRIDRSLALDRYLVRNAPAATQTTHAATAAPLPLNRIRVSAVDRTGNESGVKEISMQ